MASMDFKNSTQRFNSWNLPDVMHEAEEWIRDNEINVSGISIYADDASGDDESISSETWYVLVHHVEISHG